MDQLNNLISQLNTESANAQSKASLTRQRKLLMNIKKQCTEARKELLERSKAIPKRVRRKKGEDVQEESQSDM